MAPRLLGLRPPLAPPLRYGGPKGTDRRRLLRLPCAIHQIQRVTTRMCVDMPALTQGSAFCMHARTHARTPPLHRVQFGIRTSSQLVSTGDADDGPTPHAGKPRSNNYPDPKDGPCSAGSEEVSLVPLIDGKFCSPPCKKVGGKCPTSPKGTTAKGKCVITFNGILAYCGMTCKPSDLMTGCPPNASCKAPPPGSGAAFVGLCTYDDDDE